MADPSLFRAVRTGKEGPVHARAAHSLGLIVQSACLVVTLACGGWSAWMPALARLTSQRQLQTQRGPPEVIPCACSQHAPLHAACAPPRVMSDDWPVAEAWTGPYDPVSVPEQPPKDIFGRIITEKRIRPEIEGRDGGPEVSE
eukprot:gene38635-13520_t